MEQNPFSEWNQFQASLPKNMPTEVFNMVKQKFFDAKIQPWVMMNGESESLAYQKFMATGRTDLEQYPKTKLGIATAVKTAVEPIQGLFGMTEQEREESWSGRAYEKYKRIAEEQGSNTFIPEALGTAAGYLPYLIPAMRAVRGTQIVNGARVAGPMMASAGQRIAVGAITQGAIDGMKEAEGDRWAAAVKGAVIGGAFEAAGEALLAGGGAVKSAMMRKGASAKAAEALDAAITDSKMLSPEEYQAVREVFEYGNVADLEAINKEAVETLQHNAAIVRQLGLPKSPLDVVSSGGTGTATITLNGKTVQTTLDKLDTKVFANGASLETMSGTVQQIDAALRKIETQAMDDGLIQMPLSNIGTGIGNIPTVKPVFDFPIPKEKPDIGNLSKFITKMKSGEPVTYRSLNEKFGLDDAQADTLLSTLKQRGQLEDIGNGVSIYRAVLPDNQVEGFRDALRAQIYELPNLTPRAVAQRFAVPEAQARSTLQTLQEEGWLQAVDGVEDRWIFDTTKRSALMRKLLMESPSSTTETVGKMVEIAKSATEPPSVRGQAMMWLKENDRKAFEEVLNAGKSATDEPWVPEGTSISDLMKRNVVNTYNIEYGERKAFTSTLTGNQYDNMADAYLDMLTWSKYKNVTPDELKAIANNLRGRGATSAAEFYDRLAAWRNGKRPFPPPSLLKDTPSGQWINDVEGVLKGAQSASAPSVPGETPQIMYSLNGLSRESVWHETMHSVFSYFDLNKLFKNSEWGQKTLAYGLNFDKEIGKFYRDWWGSELLQRWPQEFTVRAMTAFRHNDIFTINAMAKAFKSTPEEFRGELLDMVKSMRENVVGEGVMARIAQRKLDSLESFSERSIASISDMRLRSKGQKVWYEKGMFAVYDSATKEKRYFKDRNLLNEFLAENQAPINAPTLVDDSVLTNMTKWQPMAKVAGVTPPSAGAPAAEPSLLGLNEPIQAGVGVFSAFFRPFTDWITTFSVKHNVPMLGEQMIKLQRLEQARINEIETFRKPLHDTFKKYGHQRLRDFNSYLEAKSDIERNMAASALNLTPSEIADLTKIRTQVMDPLKNLYGYDINAYIQNWRGKLVQRLNDPDFVTADFPDELVYGKKTLDPTEEQFFTNGVRAGYLNPSTENAYHIIESFINFASKRKWLGEDLNLAKQMINEKAADGSYVLGSIRPFLVNHLNYMKGQPDQSAKMVYSAVNNVLSAYREIMTTIDDKLPGWAKISSTPGVRNMIPDADLTAQDALAKWITYSYAGGLAFRPAVIMRDPITFFLTTVPILGMRNSMKAMGSMVTKWKDPQILDEMVNRGLLLISRDIETLVSGQEKSLTNRVVDKSLEALQWGNNWVRTTAFRGFADTIDDALGKGVTQDFLSDSKLIFLDKSRRNDILMGAQQALAAGGNDRKKWVYDMAAEMVKLTNWDYTRGNAPGAYKYTIGRVLGQYGTWPMNYVEYMRKLSGVGNDMPAKDRLAALGRLTAIHTAILNAGEYMGIDTASWVFHNPAQWSGGPTTTALINLPMAANFDDSRGADARREVGRLIFPMSVPGGLAMKNVADAIINEDSLSWQRLLGFVPMDEKKMDQGVHKALGGFLQ